LLVDQLDKLSADHRVFARQGLNFFQARCDVAVAARRRPRRLCARAALFPLCLAVEAPPLRRPPKAPEDGLQVLPWGAALAMAFVVSVLYLRPPTAWLRQGVVHVAPDGFDGRLGQSRRYALRSIQRAADLAGPGETILVWPGVYPEEIHLRRGGRPGQPVVLRAASPGRAVIRGGVIRGVGGLGASLWIEAPWVEVHDLRFDFGQKAAIQLWDTHHVLLQGNCFEGAAGAIQTSPHLRAPSQVRERHNVSHASMPGP
jgi:hypothetical protein